MRSACYIVSITVAQQPQTMLMSDMEQVELLMVLRRRLRYISRFRKMPYVKISSTLKGDVKGLKEYLDKLVKAWDSGSYLLRRDNGQIYLRFDIKDGIVSRIYDSSDVTGRPYPFFEEATRRVRISGLSFDGVKRRKRTTAIGKIAVG